MQTGTADWNCTCRPELIRADQNRYMQTGTADWNCTRFRWEQYKHTRTILSRLELTARSGCTGAGVDLYVGWVGLTILTNYFFRLCKRVLCSVYTWTII